MLSLGPLTKNKHCTYSCPFCYVGGEFLSYTSLDVERIAQWVERVDDPYDVIYISCDTDSFAPPRQDEAIDLVERLADFGTDLLFTTRALLTDHSMNRLARLVGDLQADGRNTFGCVSLCQLTVPHLEPPPIPSPAARLAQMSSLREIGVRTVLALRPFLPNVPLDDYRQIVDRAAGSAEVVLGGVWYYDEGGVLEAAVLQNEPHASLPHFTGPMPFDNNAATWRIFPGDEIERVVRETCERNNLPMFMRSGPAIEWLRHNRIEV